MHPGRRVRKRGVQVLGVCTAESRPFLADGVKCKFDGDCCSGQCSGWKCISEK